jgi:diguanylate cyclase (GGDEF)-like protein
MTMPQPEQQNVSPSLKDLIERTTDEITQRWLLAVREDRAIPSAEGLTEPLLLDAVPLVLGEILRVVELDDGKIEHERICSAARHGRERAQGHFDVRELVREYQLLRENIFLHLPGRTEQFVRFNVGDTETINVRVGAALDEAMRETIHAFVEEHVLQLRRLSRTDSLTGLNNHRVFYERLTDELNRARRYDSPLSVALIDLDDFKAINDTKGHQFGDHILITCAERMRADLRETDIICRYGGDEFGLILTETTGAEAEAMMSRLTDDFEKLARIEGVPATFGMSFGVSSHPEDNGTVQRMVKIADERLSLKKQSGKVGLALVE